MANCRFITNNMRTERTQNQNYIAEIFRDGVLQEQYPVQGTSLNNVKLTESRKKKDRGAAGLLLIRSVDTAFKTKKHGEFKCSIYRLGKGEVEIGEPTEFNNLQSISECIQLGHKHHSKYDCLGYKIVVEHCDFGEVDCQTFMF